MEIVLFMLIWLKIVLATFLKQSPNLVESTSIICASFGFCFSFLALLVCQKLSILFRMMKKCIKNIVLLIFWPFCTLWQPTSQGSPHLQTQIQTVPVISSLYPSLISLSSFTLPGTTPSNFPSVSSLGSLLFLPCCYRRTTTLCASCRIGSCIYLWVV